MKHPAFWEKDYGFRWIDCHQEASCVYGDEKGTGTGLPAERDFQQ